MMTADEWAMGKRHPVEGLNRHLPLQVSSGMWSQMECETETDWRWPSVWKRHVRCNYTVQNMCRQTIPRVELWVCAPLREASTQQVRTMKSSSPCEEIRDSLGNHLLRFTFHNVAPFAVRIAAVEATLELAPAPKAGEGACGWGMDSWLDRANGQSDGPIPRMGGTAEEVVREIYGRVRACPREAIFADGRRRVWGALPRHSCDGEEEALLFVDLCRREGIPARAMGGYLFDRNAPLQPAVFHYWAEFHLKDRWHLADPSRGVFREPSDAYVAIRILGQSDRPIGQQEKCCVLGDSELMEMEG